MASRSLAIAPSKPQREGIRYMSGLRFGFVVIGTIRPPSTTCGMSAMGVSAIAASAEATSAETSRPSAVAFIASATRFPSSRRNADRPSVEAEREEDDGEEHRALHDAEEAEQDVLRTAGS